MPNRVKKLIVVPGHGVVVVQGRKTLSDTGSRRKAIEPGQPMPESTHPNHVLYPGCKPFPALPPCVHYAGSKKLLRKSIQLQLESAMDGQPAFDISADCEDGAPSGCEHEHAEMISAVIAGADNRFGRIGCRIHGLHHPAWLDDLEVIVGGAGQMLAYLAFPKAERAEDVRNQILALEEVRARHGIRRAIPVHVLIETPGALREAWQIAELPLVECLDFGIMDYISAQHGAIPATAMRSPGQFDHPLVARAKCEIATAAVGNGVVPSHNVTLEFGDTDRVAEDARRARREFGFLRMSSIHPTQIQPIVAAMRPDFSEVEEATAIVIAGQDADWGPISRAGQLHDRASYRYWWELLQRAHATGMALPESARRRFFR